MKAPGRAPRSEQLRELQRENSRLREENERLREEKERLESENQRLEKELEAAQRAVKRQAAPFSKGQPKSHPKSPGRKPGPAYGQRVCRPVPQRVDEKLAVPAPRRCLRCGGAVRVRGVELQYQEEIVRLTLVWRFDVEVGECTNCGAHAQGHHPLQTSDALGAAHVQLGPEALALGAHLNKQVGLSLGQTSKVLQLGFGLQVSRAGIYRALARMAERAAPTYEQLIVTARHSLVNWMDETGWRVGGRSQWLWVAVSESVTVYSILPGRGFAQAASVLGADYDGWLLHDGLRLYYGFRRANHQSCLAHLIRRCRDIIAISLPSASRFARQVKGLLRHALELRDRHASQRMTRHGLATATGRLEAGLDELLNRTFRNPHNTRLAKHLRHEQPHLFTFLHCPGLDATNNVAERAIRPAVIARKVWGGTRTWNGARTQQILMSVLRTGWQHAGVGYIQQYQPTDYPAFNQSTLGLSGYFVTNRFPSIGGAFPGGSLGNTNTGGWLANGGGVGPQFISFLWEEKPTFSTSLTWVKGNHSFKYGSDLTVDGYPEHSEWRSNGSFSIQNAETSDPWQNLQPFNYTNPTGFNYASFLLGLPDRLQLSPVTQTKTGNHSIGLYAEDSWKITRKLTLDYGLRYDFQTYLKEEHGRMQDASFSTPNPVVGGLLGAVVYEGYGGGRCNCELSHNDPWAFGPRVGAAYQINSKTVLRAGAGLTYGVVQTPNGLQYGLADYYTYTGNGYGNTPLPLGLEGGNPYPNITWPNFSPGKEPVLTNGLLPPSAPTHFFDPHAVPPRTTQWSIGLQRQMSKDIVVEANYVGNRGVHWPASGLDQMACDCLTDPILAHYGLSRNNPSDMALLTQFIEPNGQINQQAAAHGINLAYPGMPPNQTVNQQILPVPQWTGGFGVTLGPFLGKTWYDSLQTKVTKRFSHGLLAQASFVWSKATDLGTGAESPTLLSYNPIFEDIFNVANNKQLNQLTRPLAVIISGTYQTPAFASDSKGMKALSQVVRGWQLGWLLRYQNGAMIESATSTNQLESELGRTGTNFDNYVPGVNRLLVNPNCGCFNPQTTLVLNTAAWTNPATGQWGTSAPFYSNYRWQRQPAESASLGRNFRMGKEGKYNLQVRAEFQNIFNRHFLSAPATGATTTGAVISNNLSTGFANVYSAGYGSIATINGAGDTPRSGQLVGRFTF